MPRCARRKGRVERRAPELALFLERFAQVVRGRLDGDRRDARFPLEHGHLLHVRLCGVPRPVSAESIIARARAPTSATISAMRGPAALASANPSSSADATRWVQYSHYSLL